MLRPWPGNVISYTPTADSNGVEGVLVCASRREALLLAMPEFADWLAAQIPVESHQPFWAFVPFGDDEPYCSATQTFDSAARSV